jgi:hypothetical protein
LGIEPMFSASTAATTSINPSILHEVPRLV